MPAKRAEPALCRKPRPGQHDDVVVASTEDGS